MSRDHRKLRAFELADQLVFTTYKLTQTFPNDERFALTSQMRRAVVSVPTNIVEGCARRTQSEYLNFLNISFASLREVGYLSSIGFRLGYFDEEKNNQFNEQYDETARVLAALIRSLQKV